MSEDDDGLPDSDGRPDSDGPAEGDGLLGGGGPDGGSARAESGRPGRRRFLAAGAAVGLSTAAGIGAAAVRGTGHDAGHPAAGRGTAAPEHVGSGTSAPEPTEAAPERTAPPSARRPVCIGTYTSAGGGKGVGIGSYDPRGGALGVTRTLTGVADPSFLALAPCGGHLYAVDERPRGAVTAMALHGPGAPRVLGSRVTGGSGPCHLSVHPGGGHLLTAHYGSGSITVHPLAGDGRLLPRSDLVQLTGSGPDPDRQDGPHVHMVLSDPEGRHVLAVDLGTDSVHTFRLAEATGTLTHVSRAAVAPGSGPRHLAFHPSGRHAYLVNELGDGVVVCRYDPATGTLTPGTAQPTVPAGSRRSGRNYPAEVVVGADGRFVYVSNRGDDSVARFATAAGGAALRLLDTTPSGGAYPRHIALDPSGALLLAANQNSGTVTAFRVDPRSGALAPAGPALRTPSPVCVVPM